MSNTIEIEIPNCPADLPPNVAGIPSWVVGWGFAVGTAIVLAIIIGTVVVVVNWREQKTKRLNAESKDNLELAKLHKNCLVCGTVYNPTSEKKS